MYCLDKNSGRILWERTAHEGVPRVKRHIKATQANATPVTEWGHAASPIIYKHLVIVQCDGHAQSFIAAFNLKDGRQVWRVERGEMTSWSTPAIYAGKSGAELIANGGKFMRSYDPLTGKELWRFAQNNVEVKQQVPLQAHGLIYLTGGYPPGSPIYVFRPGARGDISLKAGAKFERLATNPMGEALMATPAIVDGLLILRGQHHLLAVALSNRPGK